MYGTVQALSDRLGDPLEEDTSDYRRAAAALEDASVLIDTEVGQTWAPPETAPPVVRVIALRVAERAFRNPDGATQRGAGSFNEGFAYNAARGVFLSDEEKTLLEGLNVGGTNDRSLVSVEMVREFDGELSRLFLNDQYGGDSIIYGGPNDNVLWGRA